MYLPVNTKGRLYAIMMTHTDGFKTDIALSQ
jgi:hypothetical protein